MNKKTRKLNLRKSIILGVALAMGITASAFADTMDVSPVDKKVSEDKDGMIYNASYKTDRGYFWTDLGHYTVLDGDGNTVTNLYTPFFYHTHDKVWDPDSKKYDPVHEGDGSEMSCNESMSNITIGEMDRVLKALYQNDLSVYQAINGTIGADGEKVEGIKQKLFVAVKATDLGNGKTQYDYKSESGKTIGTSYDTNTTNDSMSGGITDAGVLTIGVTDTAGKTVSKDITGVASQSYVTTSINNNNSNYYNKTEIDNKISSIDFDDANTTNTGLTITKDANDNTVITVTDSEGNRVYDTATFIATKDSVQTVSNNLSQEITNRQTEDAAIRGTIFDSITSSTSGNKTTYTYLDKNKKTIGTTYDYDTKLERATLELNSNGVLKWTGYDNNNGSIEATVSNIASTTYVDNKVQEINNTISGINDTNTKNASISGGIASNGDLTINVKDTDKNTVTGTITGVATKDDISSINKTVNNISTTVSEHTTKISNIESNISTIQSTVNQHTTQITTINGRLDELEKRPDNDTVTTITTADDGWLTVETEKTDTGYNSELAFNENKLKDYVKENSKDTITTLEGDGLATVTGTETENGYHYVVSVSKEAVKEIAKAVDTNTTNKSLDIDRNSGEGTATITLTDTDGNYVTNTIEDIASHKELQEVKATNESEHEVMREAIIDNSERINNLGNRVDRVEGQVKEVGALSAALAGLNPRFTDGNKSEWMMSMGHYKSKTAIATGLAYAPDQYHMFTIGASAVGGGDYMWNLGATFALDRRPDDPDRDIKLSRREVDQIVADVKAENAELKARLAKIEALLASK